MHELQDKYGIKKAILEGYEPTLDKELVHVVSILDSIGVGTRLVTNGALLNSNLVEKLVSAGLNIIEISIKAFDENKHRIYTGASLIHVLSNFRLVHSFSLKICAESVLIPGLIDAREIGKIAEYISKLNPNTPYKIDGYWKVNQMWREPTEEELNMALRIAKRFLRNAFLPTPFTTCYVQAVYPIRTDEFVAKSLLTFD